MPLEKIRLSISVLISNRPNTVEKCLSSLDSLRRKVSSELILVDTGCGEQVRKVIESYGDKIIDFEWCNDFSKARNAGLRQAVGEWFLYLDDDEWFEDTEEIEDFFLSDKHTHYHYGSYFQRNYFDMSGRKYRDDYVGRLIRLEPGTEFIYSIHETFSRAREPRIRLHSYVHHYGYAFKNEEEAWKHGQRNITLLLAEHEKAPGELRHIEQLAQEYNALKEWEKSVAISLEGIQSAMPGAPMEQFLGGLYVNVVRNYITLGRHLDAIDLGEKYLMLSYSNELARAAVCYNLCIAYLEAEECAKIPEAIEKYLDFYERWKRNRDATALYEGLTVLFMSIGCVQAALCIGVQAGYKLGDSATVKKYFDRIDWHAIQNILETQSVKGMVQAILRAWLCTNANEAQEDTDRLKMLLKDGALAGMVVTELDILWKNMPELLQVKTMDWAALAGENWFFLYLKVRNSVEINKNIIIKDYCNLWKDPLEPLMREAELGLWKMAQRDGVNMGQIISTIPLYRWKKAVRIAAEKLDWKNVQELQGYLGKVLTADNFYMLYWSIPYRMRKIRRMAEVCEEVKDTGTFPEEIVQEWLAYARENESLYRRLFKKELFQERQYLLPQECRVSLMLLDMEEAVKGRDFQRAMSDIEKALEIMPESSDGLNCCIRWISEKLIFQN